MSKLLLALILLVALPVSAKTYKWVDDKGVTHMGDTIPPEYANKDRQELNKSGVVVKRQEVPTADERRAKEAESARARNEESSARDQKLHDKSLTDTYSNVEEIELSRKRNIGQVDAHINSIDSQLKTATDNLASLKKDAASRSKVPASLQEDIREAQERVDRMLLDLQKYKEEKQAVNARYDADKARFRELTGK